MSVKLLNEHHLEFLSLNGGCTAHISLFMSKDHIVGNYMSLLIFFLFPGTNSCFSIALFSSNILLMFFCLYFQVQSVQQIQQPQAQTQVFQQVLTPSGEVQNVPVSYSRKYNEYKLCLNWFWLILKQFLYKQKYSRLVLTHHGARIFNLNL